GTDSMTYQAFDGTDYSGIVTVTIIVNPVNDAPVGVDDRYTIDEDGSLSVPAPGVLANDYDVDGDTITAILVDPPNGLGSFSSNGALNYYPPENWHGVTTLTYMVFDGTEYSGIVTVTITVNSVNDAPVGVDDEYTIDEDTSLDLAAPGLLANDYDVDGDTITLVVVTVPSYGSGSIGADGAFSYTPNLNWHGTDSMTYRVFDGTEYSGIVTVTITVNPVNDAPVGVDDEYTIDEDGSLSVPAPGVLANDYDVDGDSLSAILVDPPNGSGSLGSNGALNYNPPADWHGVTTLTYKVFDGTEYSGIVTVTITVNSVNDAPVAVDDYVVLDEDTSILIDFMGNDYDVDDSFSWDYVAWVPTEINGELEVVYDYEVEPGVFRDVLRYTPDPDWHGSSSTINYRISDTFGAVSSIARIYITVNSVNDAPVAVDDYIVTDEDTSLIIDFLRNDYDVDDSFTFDYASWSTSGIHGELEFLPDYEIEPGIFRWVIRYTPDPDWHGTASAISYGIEDSGGLTSAAQIFITVNPVNDAPVGVDDSYTIDEDTSLNLPAPGLLSNDYDVDGDSISLDFLTYPQHGWFVLGSTGYFNYNPFDDWYGTDSFTYRVYDGMAYSGVVTVTITVTSVNDPPVAVDDYIDIDGDTSVIIDFMANDYDVDDDFNWASIGWTIADLHGTAELLLDYEIEPGVFRTVVSYTPDPNWHGSTSTINYRLRDSSGALSSTAYVHITVHPINDAPVGVDDSYTIDEDTSLNLPAPGLLSNDYDVDGDQISLDFLTYPQHGWFVLGSNGYFNYNPFDDWYGTDSFTYRVFDGTAYSGIVTVTITVNPINDPPVAVDDFI
ncbi:MAG: Ig-like domain-containing protein, partial [Candidatus Thorarchaeota archaeon]